MMTISNFVKTALAHSTYSECGCQLATEMEPALFTGLYNETGGNICKGCFHGDYENCTVGATAQAKLGKKEPKSAVTIRAEIAGKLEAEKKETNAEIAKRLGVTKRQVAKMRAAGKIK